MNKYKVRQIHPTGINSELTAVDFDKNYLPRALDKYSFNLIKIHSLSSPAANILKQTALSKGGDLGVGTGVVTCKKEHTDAILAATDRQLKYIIEALHAQPFGLKKLAQELEVLLNKKNSKPEPLQINNKSFQWGSKTYLMGILNITPDSFSDGGKYLNPEDAIEGARHMLESGVDIIDVGGESTRPFSQQVDSESQINRVIPVIKEIKKQFPQTVISIDTRCHKVAGKAIETGADIVNDISGFNFDKEMPSLVASSDVPVILMHSLSTPDTMQIDPHYNNLMDDICNSLLNSVEIADKNGIDVNKIIIDPGLGFGKTTENNLEIIRKISEIKSLGFPVLVGCSRKNFIGKLLDCDINSREEGTAAINAYLISEGVDILRIHDIQYHSKATRMVDFITRT